MEARAVSRTYGAVDESGHHALPPSVGNSENTSLIAEPFSLSSRAVERSSRRSWLTIAFICAMAVGTIVATNRSASSTSPAFGASSPAKADNSLAAESRRDSVRSAPLEDDPSLGMLTAQLSFTVTNFYHERDGKPGAQIPWLQNVKLAEPYMETFLRVVDPRDGYDYTWTISSDEEGDEVLATASGAEAEVLFTRLDKNIVTLKEHASGTVSRASTEIVMVKYVRREIRTLTDEDREELFDSMLKLWTVRVQDGPGKELYGEDYADIWAINRLHFKAASPIFCDHFHDGMGFLTSHSLLTNTFEFSLQRVNPKLTVPYWDFTIETSTFGGNTPDKIEPQIDSPLLHDAWFGTNDPSDGMVKDSRWAKTEIPRVKINNPGEIDADVYSKLRAPWNVNDRAYLTRGLGEMCGVRVEEKYSWPSCQSHYDLVTLYDDFYSWVWTSLYDPHGPVHVWLGGVLDCDETYAKLKDLVGPNIATNLAYFAFVHRKNLFRSGIFSCEGTADVNVTPGELFENGQCGCLGVNLDSGDDYIQIRDQIVFLTDYIEDFPDYVQRDVVATICNGIMNDGDHLQASSSLDPSFWVTHPTMERLFMFKRLTGTLTDLSWPDEDTTYVSSNGETVQEMLSLYDETCNGHRGKDVFPFDLASDESSTFMARTQIRGDNDAGNTLNNREILQLLDPRVDSFNYIYDTFEWKHCVADGIDFNDAWETDSADSIKTAKVRPGRPTFLAGEQRYPRYGFFLDVAEKLKGKAQSKA